MKLNVEVWNKKRIEVETQIKALKVAVRAPGHMITWKEYEQLKALKEEATGLYMLRAELRGKRHCKVFVYHLNTGIKGKTKKVTESFSRAEQASLVLVGEYHWCLLKSEPQSHIALLAS